MKKITFFIFIKSLIKGIIPPFLLKLIIFFKNKDFLIPKYTYSGNFSSMNEAYSNTNQKSFYLNDSYDSIIANTTCEKLSNYKLLNNYISNESNGCHERKGFLLLLCISFCNELKKTLNIVDYGGATNPQYIFLTSEKRNENNFFVIDRANLISKIKNKIEKEKLNFPKNLSFHSFESDFLKKHLQDIDIVFFGSCIQYVDNLKDVIKDFAKKGCKYFLFSDSVFTKSINDLYVIQSNMPNTNFPNKWHSRSKFELFMKAINYELIANWKISSKNDHQSFPREFFDHQTFIYKKCS